MCPLYNTLFSIHDPGDRAFSAKLYLFNCLCASMLMFIAVVLVLVAGRRILVQCLYIYTFTININHE